MKLLCVVFLSLLIISFIVEGSAQPVCTLKADIVIMIDESGSVGPANFVILQNFAKNLVTRIDTSMGGVGQSANRIAVMFFGGDVRIKLYLDGIQNGMQVNNVIGSEAYNGGVTPLTEALRRCRTEVLIAARGHRGHNIAPDIAIVLTDGDATDESPIPEATALKQHGATIIAVGIGPNIKPAELIQISSSGTYITVANFQVLSAKMDELVKASCDCGGGGCGMNPPDSSCCCTYPLNPVERMFLSPFCTGGKLCYIMDNSLYYWTKCYGFCKRSETMPNIMNPPPSNCNLGECGCCKPTYIEPMHVCCVCIYHHWCLQAPPPPSPLFPGPGETGGTGPRGPEGPEPFPGIPGQPPSKEEVILQAKAAGSGRRKRQVPASGCCCGAPWQQCVTFYVPRSCDCKSC